MSSRTFRQRFRPDRQGCERALSGAIGRQPRWHATLRPEASRKGRHPTGRHLRTSERANDIQSLSLRRASSPGSNRPGSATRTTGTDHHPIHVDAIPDSLQQRQSGFQFRLPNIPPVDDAGGQCHRARKSVQKRVEISFPRDPTSRHADPRAPRRQARSRDCRRPHREYDAKQNAAFGSALLSFS